MRATQEEIDEAVLNSMSGVWRYRRRGAIHQSLRRKEVTPNQVSASLRRLLEKGLVSCRGRRMVWVITQEGRAQVKAGESSPWVEPTYVAMTHEAYNRPD